MRTYIQQPGQVGVQGGTIGNAGYLAQMPPSINPAAHRGAQKGAKIYNKGVNTENPYEKKTFLDRTGPQLPPMARLDGSMNMNMGQMNDAYLQEQERQRLLQEQQAQSELNASMFGGGQYGQADQYSAASAGFQNKFVS
jgi:hypothetical protein